MVIDFHTHTFPSKIAAAVLRKLSGLSHTAPFTDGTEAGLTASMARAGIDWSVNLPVATAADQVPGINDKAVALNRAAEHGLRSFGCMHPDYPRWHEELGRIAQLGLKGIKIHPVYQGVDLDDPRFLRILTRAGELGLTVVTHSGYDVGFPGVEHTLPAKVRRAMDQVGPVRLVCAHMGGWKSWAQAEELLAETPVLLDTAFATGLMTPLPEEMYYSPAELQLLTDEQFVHMVRAFGAERILFGTDSPWSGQKETLDWFRSLPLTPAEQDAILGGNACKLLGIEAD